MGRARAARELIMDLFSSDGVEYALRNLSWMSGNTFLAWIPVMFAFVVFGTERQQSLATRIVPPLIGIMLLARLTVRRELFEHPVKTVFVVALVAGGAWFWTWCARARDRWALGLGVIGAVAFAPNAPYVLTDCFHFVQDIRSTRMRAGDALIFAAEYAWFLAVASTAWIVLLDLGRRLLREYRPTWSPFAVLGVVSVVMAFGIYLGRIERFHSWHPIVYPVRFVRETFDAFTDVQPLAFVVIWAIVIAVVSWIGLGILDRSRKAPSFVRQPSQAGVAVISALAWTIASALLFAAPFVGVLFVSACMLQWWAQYRGLCEYGPDVKIHGEQCAGVSGRGTPRLFDSAQT